MIELVTLKDISLRNFARIYLILPVGLFRGELKCTGRVPFLIKFDLGIGVFET